MERHRRFSAKESPSLARRSFRSGGGDGFAGIGFAVDQAYFLRQVRMPVMSASGRSGLRARITEIEWTRARMSMVRRRGRRSRRGGRIPDAGPACRAPGSRRRRRRGARRRASLQVIDDAPAGALPLAAITIAGRRCARVAARSRDEPHGRRSRRAGRRERFATGRTRARASASQNASSWRYSLVNRSRAANRVRRADSPSAQRACPGACAGGG